MPEHYDVAPLEGFHPEIGLLLASLEDSTREWREYLGEPPMDAIVWPSAPDGHSIGALILHMIDAELYWFEQVVAGMPPDPEQLKLLMSDEVDQDNARWPIPPAKPISWYFELHDQLRKRGFEALRNADPARILTHHSYTCTVRWILAHVVEHDSYTGGQAVVLHEIWKKSQGGK